MDDLELMARLIQCEAGGEGLEGMAAVASVIANRLRTFEGEYGRQQTLREVVFAPRQFECALSNHIRNIWTVFPEQIHYDIASWALNGGVYGVVGNALWFFNPFSSVCPPTFPSGVGIFHVRLREHCFYVPTAQYYST